MAKEGSVAPKERVNITYKSEDGGVERSVELPFKILMVGDYTGRDNPAAVADRAPVRVDKHSFGKFMSEQNLSVKVEVKNKLGEGGESLGLELNPRKLADFGPDGIVEAVPELKRLKELRDALDAVRYPLGSVAGFRKKLQEMLGSQEQRSQLMKELGLE